jgi:hypothetical protein
MVSDPEPRPTLVLNPPDDEAFRASAEHLVESGIAEPSTLQARLRQQWPLALVRPRELAGEPSQVWYVYRDGHWIRQGPASNGAAVAPSSSQEGRNERPQPERTT